MTTESKATIEVHTLSKDEALALFDKAAQRELHMSASEFLAALDAGQFKDDAESPAIVRLSMLLPLVRG